MLDAEQQEVDEEGKDDLQGVQAEESHQNKGSYIQNTVFMFQPGFDYIIYFLCFKYLCLSYAKKLHKICIYFAKFSTNMKQCTETRISCDTVRIRCKINVLLV